MDVDPKKQLRFLQADELKTAGREGYLKGVLELGLPGIAENAIAEVRALAVGGAVLPVLVVRPTRENCDLCSPMAHHVHYSCDEVLLKTPRGLGWLVRLAYLVFGGLMRLGRIDRVVYVNNWLYSTNPRLELESEELGAIARFLEQQFPQHAQDFRSVHPGLFPDQKILFESCGYTLIKSRDIFIWARDDSSYLERKNYRMDRRLLQRSTCRVIEPERFGAAEAERLHELYCGLYLDKHNTLNARLTEQFFTLSYESGALTYRFLMEGDQIMGFYAYEIIRDIFQAVVIGYDLTVPRKQGLYRQIVMSCIQQAKQMGLSLNFSAGVDHFKASRGGQSIIEYEAIRYGHLPLRQRLAWGLLELKCRLSVWLRSWTFR